MFKLRELEELSYEIGRCDQHSCHCSPRFIPTEHTGYFAEQRKCERFVNAIHQHEIEQLVEYRLVSDFYGDRIAERSRVPLMNHINEGIDIIWRRGGSERAIRAFCLHPLLQKETDFAANFNRVLEQCMAHVVHLAIQYRIAANAFLCTLETDSWAIEDAENAIGPMSDDLREMLIADKVQNRRDFMIHHFGTHPRSDQLFRYFNMWVDILGVANDGSSF